MRQSALVRESGLIGARLREFFLRQRARPRHRDCGLYQKLAEQARQHPLSAAEHMWDVVPQCVPDGPIELRAKVKSLSWKDGVMTVIIEDPIGWVKPPGRLPTITVANRYLLAVTEQQALKMRAGTWFICRGDWKLFTDTNEYRAKHHSTHWVVATMHVASFKSAHLASENLVVESLAMAIDKALSRCLRHLRRHRKAALHGEAKERVL